MSWFNYIGFAAIVLILVPNAIYAKKNPNGFQNVYRNKAMEIGEQIGRYGCFLLMIFNLPETWFGFWFEGAFTVYAVGTAVLVALYLLGWITCWNRHFLFRAYALSVLPSVLFLFTGILLRNVPISVCACIFAPCHITISVKNACFEGKNKAEPKQKA